MNFKVKYGIVRSWIMYYAKPFNRKRLRSFYSQFISSNSLVFDIGAHLGNRSEAFLDLGARVIAVEPQPSCIQFLKNKFKSNPKFTLLPIIAGKDFKEKVFYINSLSPTISTARDEDWQIKINSYTSSNPPWDKRIKVKSTTLDKLMETYGLPVFCKIDTEGYEFEVLSGLSRSIPCISIEYLAFDTGRMIKCIDKLADLGNYVINFSPGESQQWLWANWKSPEEIKNILSEQSLGYKFGDFYFKLG